MELPPERVPLQRCLSRVVGAAENQSGFGEKGNQNQCINRRRPRQLEAQVRPNGKTQGQSQPVHNAAHPQ